MEENIRNNDPTQNYKENMGNEYLINKINGKFNHININQEKTFHNKKSNFYLNKINEM